MTDIEIARKVECENISKIAEKIGIEKYIENYGKNKAKINFQDINSKMKGKLVLVTAISPTPYGEGKTTVAIGLNDALCKLKENSIAVLREPSLGPVFGVKGGATGGGYSQVIPMEDINLHFNGDFHAITTANNLISAAIDNHLYFGNELDIDSNQICFRRCLDMNDRALRKVTLNNREEVFNITAASEIMSILCLSNDFLDLKQRLGDILIAYNTSGKPIYAKDLKLQGSLATILKDAIKPNLVQSLEHNPVIIHGGPFANIAHGCNSIIATKLGLKLGDYVVTEAGFGTDLGAEKFFDIKCRVANLKPSAICLVATTKALKHNGGVEKDKINEPNLEAIKRGIANLEVHMDNMLKFSKNLVVTLNKYDTDVEEEIAFIKSFVEEKGVLFSLNDAYSKGSDGALDLAKKIIELTTKENDFKVLYESNLSVQEKMEVLAKEIYHAGKVNYSKLALDKIKRFEEMGYKDYPVCVAKTQYSISDNPELLGSPKDFEITIEDANIYTGAKFIVIYLGKIMTMPGLSKHANYEKIDINEKGVIEGLF